MARAGHALPARPYHYHQPYPLKSTILATAANPNDMSRHTHKRSRLAEFGVTISGCDWGTRETHTHGWPDGGYGSHWHCKIDE